MILCAWNTSALATAKVYPASLPQNQDHATWRGPVFKVPETKDNRLILYLETMNNESLEITGTPVRFVLAGRISVFRKRRRSLSERRRSRSGVIKSPNRWPPGLPGPVVPTSIHGRKAACRPARSGPTIGRCSGAEKRRLPAKPRTPQEVRPSPVGLSAEGPSTSMWNMCYS
jgi:hypothetical protein